MQFFTITASFTSVDEWEQHSPTTNSYVIENIWKERRSRMARCDKTSVKLELCRGTGNFIRTWFYAKSSINIGTIDSYIFTSLLFSRDLWEYRDVRLVKWIPNISRIYPKYIPKFRYNFRKAHSRRENLSIFNIDILFESISCVFEFTPYAVSQIK